MKPNIQPIKELFSKQMTRKEFLQLFGIAILSIFGVSNFISYLVKNSHQNSRPADISKASTAHGFGSRKFGA